MAFSFDLNSQGYLKKRESFDLEYKQNFQLGDNLLKYIKTMIGMANNRGGEIVFGVKDSPHILIGMTIISLSLRTLRPLMLKSENILNQV